MNSDDDPNEDERKTLARQFLRTHLLCQEVLPGNQEQLELEEDDLPPAHPLPTRRRLPFTNKRQLEEDLVELDRHVVRRVGGKIPHKPPMEPEADIPDLGLYFADFPELSELDQVKLCRAYANYLSAKDARNRIRYTSGGKSWKSTNY